MSKTGNRRPVGCSCPSPEGPTCKHCQRGAMEVIAILEQVAQETKDKKAS